MTDDFVSPYLNRPLRTQAQAVRDMAAQRLNAGKIEGMEDPESAVRADERPFPKKMKLMNTGVAQHFSRVNPG